MISVTKLHKGFGQQKVLRGLDLDIQEQSITCIMGASGTGKSVFLKLLMGLLKPDSGSIKVDDQEITGLNEHQMNEVRMKFGMLFQDAALFDDMTVFENVAFPMVEHTNASDKEIADRVHEKLADVGLENIDKKMPNELSGGMRKRVGLARALMLDPQIVLFDEPTTGLDPITTNQIGELILETHKRYPVTFLIISHDLGLTYKVADHVVFFDQGVVADQGKTEEIRRTKQPFVRKFLDAQANMDKIQS